MILLPPMQDNEETRRRLGSLLASARALASGSKAEDDDAEQFDWDREMIRGVFFVGMHSELEFAIRQVAHAYAFSFSFDSSALWKTGAGLAAVEPLLKKNGILLALWDTELWKDAKLLGQVRNCYAHSSGWTDDLYFENFELEKLQRFGFKPVVGHTQSGVIRRFKLSAFTLDRIAQFYGEVIDLAHNQMKVAHDNP